MDLLLLLFPSPEVSVRKILNLSSSGSGSGYFAAALLLRDSNVSRGSTANVFTILPFRSTLMSGFVSLCALPPVVLGRKLLWGPTCVVGAPADAPAAAGDGAGDGRGLPTNEEEKRKCQYKNVCVFMWVVFTWNRKSFCWLHVFLWFSLFFFFLSYG